MLYSQICAGYPDPYPHQVGKSVHEIGLPRIKPTNVAVSFCTPISVTGFKWMLEIWLGFVILPASIIKGRVGALRDIDGSPVDRIVLDGPALVSDLVAVGNSTLHLT